MQISSRFTIAVHVLTCIDTFKNEKVTSEFLASSVQVNPVIIRKILSQLKAADIIKVQRGSGGSTIIKSPNEITFYDIYEAVECINNDELFHFHENPNQNCPVGRNIHYALDDKLQQVQAALENELKQITLQDVIDDTQKYIELETLK
ncbi:MAG: Rrf2 family transcriptional regulator [Erysipelotrichaceae bacterium]|nr:Rrf2 family transcriptional regulator [Erysipelotrichaceae bacterium]